MHQPPDLAHIAHAELLTPIPDESLQFFVEMFGMQIEHQEGQSVFLRGWGDYQRYGLKLTEAKLPGLGHIAIRAWSPEALQRRVRGSRPPAWARAGTRATTATAPRTSSGTPTAIASSSSTRQDRYVPPESCARVQNVPQRQSAGAPRSSASTT